MRSMKFKKASDVDVGHTVAVGEAEVLFFSDISCDALQSTTCHRVFARVDQRHLPRLGVALMHMHLIALHVERDV